jgi:hypothetical protein
MKLLHEYRGIFLFLYICSSEPQRSGGDFYMVVAGIGKRYCHAN